MKKEDLIILILALLLLAGMLYTLFIGGEESRHGVGSMASGLWFAGFRIRNVGAQGKDTHSVSPWIPSKFNQLIPKYTP